MAHLPGDPAQPGAAAVAAEVPGTRARRHAGALGGARRGMLRQGVRHDLPWPPALAGGRRGARNRSLVADRDARARRPVPAGGHPAGLLHRRARAGSAAAHRGEPAPPGRARPADHRADCAEPQFLQRPAAVLLHRARRRPRRGSDPPLGIGRAAQIPGLGLRFSRSQPGDAVHPGQLLAADPPGVRQRRVPGERGGRPAAAGRCASRAPARAAARRALGPAVCADRAAGRLRGRAPQQAAVPHHPRLPDAGVRRAGGAADGAHRMAVILDFIVQLCQMMVVLALAPLLTGYVRKVKALLVGRRGPPLVQPYRDLLRLLRKEVVLAHSASWVFRATPYLVFAATWVAAALVPTFATGLLFSYAADMIAIVALLGSARFMLALAGLDVGTSFGGIGSSREMMIASLAEPAMLMVVFTLSLLAGATQLSSIAAFMQGSEVGLRVSLALALVALVMVAIAENGRIPVDNPATHLELTMVHEAMILEYSGRHLALIEAASFVKLLLYVSVIGCVFAPWGIAAAGDGALAYLTGVAIYVAKLAVAGFLLAVFETAIAKMRVFRYSDFLGAALMLGVLAALLRFVSRLA